MTSSRIGKSKKNCNNKKKIEFHVTDGFDVDQIVDELAPRYDQFDLRLIKRWACRSINIDLVFFFFLMNRTLPLGESLVRTSFMMVGSSNDRNTTTTTTTTNNNSNNSNNSNNNNSNNNSIESSVGDGTRWATGVFSASDDRCNCRSNGIDGDSLFSSLFFCLGERERERERREKFLFFFLFRRVWFDKLIRFISHRRSHRFEHQKMQKKKPKKKEKK